MKVVLDTNILFVALSSKTPYHLIWQKLIEGAYTICVTTDILSEYEEKLQQRFRPGVSDYVMDFFMRSPDVVFTNVYYYWNLIKDDFDDNKFVDCAVSSNSDFIVTNDKHFRVLADIPFPSVKVISADDFLALLRGL
jgi:uncharacterized protein